MKTNVFITFCAVLFLSIVPNADTANPPEPLTEQIKALYGDDYEPYNFEIDRDLEQHEDGEILFDEYGREYRRFDDGTIILWEEP